MHEIGVLAAPFLLTPKTGGPSLGKLLEWLILASLLFVPEEGWFGQPKYSTHIKTFLRCAGFCLYFLHFTIFASNSNGVRPSIGARTGFKILKMTYEALIRRVPSRISVLSKCNTSCCQDFVLYPWDLQVRELYKFQAHQWSLFLLYKISSLLLDSFTSLHEERANFSLHYF